MTATSLGGVHTLSQGKDHTQDHACSLCQESADTERMLSSGPRTPSVVTFAGNQGRHLPHGCPGERRFPVDSVATTECKLHNVHVCTLVNAWLVKEKPPVVQVAVGGGSMASHVHIKKYASWYKKTPPAQVSEGQDYLGQ